MSAPEAVLTPKEARRRLLAALKARKKGGIVQFAAQPLLDPIVQRDAGNKRRLHPMLVVGGVMTLLAFGAMFFFSHTH